MISLTQRAGLSTREHRCDILGFRRLPQSREQFACNFGGTRCLRGAYERPGKIRDNFETQDALKASETYPFRGKKGKELEETGTWQV